MFRLAVDTPVSLGLEGFENGYPAGSFLWIVNNIYFQYFSLLIFLICVGDDDGRELCDAAATRGAAWSA